MASIFRLCLAEGEGSGRVRCFAGNGGRSRQLNPPLYQGKGGTHANTMKVRVQFYAQLRDLVGTREVDMHLVEGSTVRDLLDQIYAQQPKLRSHDKTILIGAGVEFVDRNYRLKPDEEISIMPPVQGG